MAVTNFTPLLGLALPTTGDLQGTWGTTVNTAITDLLDDAVAGTVTLSADTDVTLTTTNGADNQARNAVILCTGARTGIKTITAPAQSKAYIIINATSGGFGVKIVGAGPSTPGVTVPNGERALVAWNSTLSDFVQIASSVIDLTSEVTGILPILNGGTGTSSTTFTNLTTNVTGVLPAANGGTGVANNASSTITISGAFASNFTVSGAYTYTFPGQTSSLGYLNIPQSGSAKTTSYALVTTDIGKVIEVGTGGSITVPNATFAAGDAIIIFNNTSGAITMTMTITNAYIAGTDADKATIDVATRGVANILFVTGTTCVVTGNVS
jgi:hypothetical protein